MSGALARPGGDPAAIEEFAAQLVRGGASTGDVAVGIARRAAGIREQARWTGAAADSYTGFTSGLSHAVGTLDGPVGQAAVALRDYAASLRAAQQRVDAYTAASASMQPLVQVAGSVAPAPLVSVQGAGLAGLHQDAVAALAAHDAQAQATAARLLSLAEEMTREFFGTEGPFRTFLEQAHSPWDAAAGDAVLENLLKGAEAAGKAVKNSAGLPEAIAKLQQEIVTPVADQVAAGGADARTNLKAMLAALNDYQAVKGETVGQVEQALAASDPSLIKYLGSMKGLAVGADLSGALAGIYTIVSPPKGDHGAWRIGDRFAGIGAAAGGGVGVAKNAFGVDFANIEVNLGPLETLEVVPDLGVVVTTAAGLYFTVDWAVHHPAQVHYIMTHPYQTGCNLLGNMFGKQTWQNAGCGPPPGAGPV